ncbi:MAG: hypothetical protein GY854_30780 [Deltaproteobacteria bacterium]|nr:hypothetical protein [Deltaproteobacteria bacterium]
MSTSHTDTHPTAEKVQIDLLRQASPRRRVALVRSLSRTVIELSRRAIRRANPDASEDEVLLIFVSLHYGEDLAAAVRHDLERRKA